jgi:pilus assembly protein Flp/PilA
MRASLLSTDNIAGKVSVMLWAPKETGQSLVENAIILVLVALIIVAILWLLGFRIGNYRQY